VFVLKVEGPEGAVSARGRTGVGIRAGVGARVEVEASEGP